MKNNKKVLIGILSICLVAALAIGGTLAFLTDSEKVTNKFTVGDIDINLEEPNWFDGVEDDPLTEENEYVQGDGENLVPGDTKLKDPTITAVLNNSYMRAVVTIIDKETNLPITDPDRLEKILQTIYFDSSYNASGNPITSGLTEGKKYTTTDLASYPMTNGTDFTFVEDKSSSDTNPTGVYYFNYNSIFEQGDVTTLFTNIVVPSDWNQNDLAVLGEYKVEVFAQAIQASNFADATEAFKALDAEIDNNTLQQDYKS